jgi:flavodoxin
MKTLILYKSVHQGNTRRVAKEMADVLSADLREPHEVDADMMEKYDLVGFGSGIYWLRHHTEILQLASRLHQMKGKKAFIFSTRGSGSVTLCHFALKKKLENAGFKIVGEFSCKAHDAVGPLKLIGGINRGRPNEADLEKARIFAKGLRI